MINNKTIKNYLVVLVFISPWIIGFIFFIGGPMLSTFWLGFTRYDVFRSPKFIGLTNYYRLFFEDEVFIKSLTNTLYYTALNVPLGVFGSLLIASMLNNNLPGKNIFRTVLYIPSITSGIAMAMLWMWIFDPGVGIVNEVLRNIGVSNPPLWFKSTVWVKPTMVLVKIVEIGGARMIIFLAALQNTPADLYEVAYIEGANAWTRFRKITLPMISPILLLNLITAIIDSFRVFINSYAITEGGPLNESMFLVLYIYKNAFSNLKMGYASAISSIFLVIIFVITLIQMKLSNKWVTNVSE